ncbi:MAG: YXWGXW repeat-containing protein [Deltaproteobacteria bacterium]|nr:YXWGXW repeat-containing protein [Deltaproteobacteria bacterium]
MRRLAGFLITASAVLTAGLLAGPARAHPGDTRVVLTRPHGPVMHARPVYVVHEGRHFFHAPPPPVRRVVLPPRLRAGYVWVPGTWTWSFRLDRIVWIDGHWVMARRGHRWMEARWVETPRGWTWMPGYWRR